ncbi:MAG: isoaspartyl peptidase/L-asparaginase, partial [Planctomycetota bacterium]
MTLLVAATWLVIPCQAQQPTTKWAIAIHGGAGGTPDKWSQEKRDKRVEGLRDALKAGKQRLENGDSAVDVVQSVIEMLEDNPMFNAGRGAVKNTDNSCQLDASIMDGRTKSCGGVAAVTTVRNPIGLARIVMEKTRHVLMVGPGAERLAEQYRLPIVDNSYFLSRDVRPGHPEMYFGTVGCVVRDAKGNLAAGTSTGGTSKKLPGRVGDSPIIGAGTYADNASCAVSCTGTGEEYIRNAIAYDISAAMRYRRTDLRSATENAIHQTLQRDVPQMVDGDQAARVPLQR